MYYFIFDPPYAQSAIWFYGNMHPEICQIRISAPYGQIGLHRQTDQDPIPRLAPNLARLWQAILPCPKPRPMPSANLNCQSKRKFEPLYPRPNAFHCFNAAAIGAKFYRKWCSHMLPFQTLGNGSKAKQWGTKRRCD
jgi:hypothetical protein